MPDWLVLGCLVGDGRIKVLFILFGVLVGIITSCNGGSESCLSLYKEGGVLAVLESPECSFEYLHPRVQDHTTKCHFALLQGRRKYQEDRVLCDPTMQFDLGNSGQENTRIGLAAVFDGHGGKEASELAVQLLPYYLQLHINFLSQKEMELYEDGHDMAFPLETEVTTFKTHFRRLMNESKMMEIIEEGILRTFHDIDSTFSQVALKKHQLAGTTANIALIVNDQLLIANVGDSKALLCSEKMQTSNGASTTSINVTELTRDHHPDRDDERTRIIATGGFVSLSGVPRVNGILAVSRSIGDVFLKRYGVIAEPEVTGWLKLNASDLFLVVASDGMFESLSPQDVCTLLQSAHSQGENQSHQMSPKCLSSSLAKCIIDVAYEKGSSDNLSAVVVPLRKGW